MSPEKDTDSKIARINIILHRHGLSQFTMINKRQILEEIEANITQIIRLQNEDLKKKYKTNDEQHTKQKLKVIQQELEKAKELLNEL